MRQQIFNGMNQAIVTSRKNQLLLKSVKLNGHGSRNLKGYLHAIHHSSISKLSKICRLINCTISTLILTGSKSILTSISNITTRVRIIVSRNFVETKVNKQVINHNQHVMSSKRLRSIITAKKNLQLQ